MLQKFLFRLRDKGFDKELNSFVQSYGSKWLDASLLLIPSTGFLPVDAYRVLSEGLPDTEIVDATFALELTRAVKSPAELDLLRTASEKVVEAMLAVFSSHGPGSTKTGLVDALRDEQG